MIRSLILVLAIAPSLLHAEVLGDAMPDGDAVSLSHAIASMAEKSSVTTKIEGEITQVCLKKGCWMVIVDGDNWARVTFKDYGFFVPLDSAGANATIAGELSREVLSQKDARHFAHDAGDDPSAIHGDTTEYAIVASSVQLAE